MSDYILVMATASSMEEGERIAKAVVGEGLAALLQYHPLRYARSTPGRGRYVMRGR